MRLKPDDRKLQILKAALVVTSEPGGWSTLTRKAVATQAECAEALVSKYFGTMTDFRRTIMRAVIHHEILEIIAQGLAAGDVHAKKASDALKLKALETLQ